MLRMQPPVPLQFGRARRDFVLRSHDQAFQVAQGELLCGYQPLAMRDPRVFIDRPEEFVPERFLGDAGAALLQHLYWSNGPETGRPEAGNKQCAAKEVVVDTACMLLAELFRRYDDFQVEGSYCNDSRSARDGTCAGVGCCHIDVPPGLTDYWMRFSSWSHADMELSPCDYAFMVEKGSYAFRAADLHMNATGTTMPLRLDWAIRDGNGSSMSMSCAQAVSKPGYTCRGSHSDCVDSTNGPGYFCNCSKGYEGNPYLDMGCTTFS